MANVTSAPVLSGLSASVADLSGHRWSTSFAVVVVSLLALFIKTTWQPAWPRGTPKLTREWPIVGALGFFTRRKTFFEEAVRQSPTTNFSTYVGKYQVVGLSGPEARKVFFENKDLGFNEGYAPLFTASPTIGKTKEQGTTEDFSPWMIRNLIKLMQRENFVRNLPLMVSDASASLDRIVERDGNKGSGTFDPFDDAYKMVYQMTMRTLGANEVAQDLPLLWKTLSLFEKIESSVSPMRIIFPWLPTLGWLGQTISGARLYAIFDNVAKKRKSEQRREDDSFQYLLDSGVNMVYILSFIIGGLYAGQLNSGINAAWLLTFLSGNKEWFQRVRDEVDASLRKHRTSPSQSPAEVLQTLSIDDWESEFPSIDLGLRESIRHVTCGTAFRRNVSNHDVALGGGSGEVMPPGSFALYMPDDAHMNPAVYADPTRFDPARFLPDRAEDKKTPLAYVGWGAGRHPCLGMRFAKLEMGIITAMFVASFDWEVVDGEGKPMRELPAIDRQKYSAHKPDVPIRLRYTVRKH